jgi:hypothetical protein
MTTDAEMERRLAITELPTTRLTIAGREAVRAS